MTPLGELQRALAASLARGAAPPEGCDPGQLAWARRALERKRRRAAAHLLPRIKRALGATWPECFHAHVEAYVPTGVLYHVDDAWAFGESLARDRRPEVRRAARDDLLSLRLHYVRALGAQADRVRERHSPLIAVTRTGRRTLVIRLPGTAGVIWQIPLGRRG